MQIIRSIPIILLLLKSNNNIIWYLFKNIYIYNLTCKIIKKTGKLTKYMYNWLIKIIKTLHQIMYYYAIFHNFLTYYISSTII